MHEQSVEGFNLYGMGFCIYIYIYMDVESPMGYLRVTKVRQKKENSALLFTAAYLKAARCHWLLLLMMVVMVVMLFLLLSPHPHAYSSVWSACISMRTTVVAFVYCLCKKRHCGGGGGSGSSCNSRRVHGIRHTAHSHVFYL